MAPALQYFYTVNLTDDSASNIVEGHAAVRSAARDTDNYSSNLMGDRDVRTYRQIPLELDPPRHHGFRTALSPIFIKPTIEKLVPQFEEIANHLVTDFINNGGGDLVSQVAMPMVLKSLGVIYNRAQDVDEWASWGSDVWITTPTGRTGAHLDKYLTRVFDEAETSDDDNVWKFVSKIEIDGQPISRTEMYGIANVLLAGGRDTVIKLMTAMIWHLGNNAKDRKFLQENPESVKTAISEVLRFVSPLPAMERAPASQKNLPDDQRNPDEYVRLSFASGNHDPEAFESPEIIDIHRARNPHLSFGFGPHTCIGNHVAELETLSLMKVFLTRIKDWEISKDSEITFTTVNKSLVPDRFHSLEVIVEKN